MQSCDAYVFMAFWPFHSETSTVSKATPTVNVSITGTLAYGETLTAVVDTNSNGTKHYQWWYATSSTATSGTNISGATSSTYRIDNGDYVGKYIGCTVTVQATSTHNSATGSGITDSSALKIQQYIIWG